MNYVPVQSKPNFKFYWFLSSIVSDASQWNAALLRPFLSDMVLRSGRQRMDTWENLSDSKPQRCDRFRNTIMFQNADS